MLVTNLVVCILVGQIYYLCGAINFLIYFLKFHLKEKSIFLLYIKSQHPFFITKQFNLILSQNNVLEIELHQLHEKDN